MDVRFSVSLCFLRASTGSEFSFSSWLRLAGKVGQIGFWGGFAPRWTTTWFPDDVDFFGFGRNRLERLER